MASLIAKSDVGEDPVKYPPFDAVRRFTYLWV
jgi:hypothetical protein